MAKIKHLGLFSVFAVLMVATVWNFETASVVPAIALLMGVFPEEPAQKVTFISSAPYITSIIFSIVCGRLATRFDKKSIAIFGLLLYGAAGISPAFVSDINLIIALRILTGVGVGLCIPITPMIIAEYYTGKERERMNGFTTAIFNVSNALISIIVGLLLFAGWQAAFYSFIYIFVILLLVIIGMPKSPPNIAVREVKNN